LNKIAALLNKIAALLNNNALILNNITRLSNKIAVLLNKIARPLNNIARPLNKLERLLKKIAAMLNKHSQFFNHLAAMLSRKCPFFEPIGLDVPCGSPTLPAWKQKSGTLPADLTFVPHYPIGSSPLDANQRLGRKTPTHVSKRIFKLALVGCLLATVSVWFLRSPENPRDDGQKFRQMVRAERWSSRIHSTERHLPLFLITALRLEGSRLSNEELARTQREALLASGFLTNASLTITNLFLTATNRPSAFLEVYRRLRMLRGIDYWSFHMQSNQVVVTCRPSDVPRIRSWIEVP
jgi:hypothetical protein